MFVYSFPVATAATLMGNLGIFNSLSVWERALRTFGSRLGVNGGHRIQR
jgi:hypothetical protein